MKYLALLAAFLVYPLPGFAETLGCRVVGISDGDTLTCLTAQKQQVKVRLAEIDTPERAQPYGSRSRQALSDLAFGKDVILDVQERDRYGRTVARVQAGGTDVNRELVSQGAAWVYRAYNRDKSLLAVEAEAKAARRGLWSLAETDRMPPWEWRKAGKKQIRPTLATIDEPSSFQCGTKTYCKEMSSCAEATFYLHQCGLTKLDGDKDGRPCESLCR